MHSNQAVMASTQGHPLTSRQIQAALLDPKSPLSLDLKNAIENAILTKKAHENVNQEFIYSQIIELEIEKIEIELAKERKASYDNYMNAFAAYYKQIEQLVIKNDQLLNAMNDANNFALNYPILLHSFAMLIQAMAVTKNELVQLHDERKLLLQKYANNQQGCGKAFSDMFNNPTIPYVVNNHPYYLDMKRVPSDKLAEVLEHKQNAFHALSNPRTLEEIIAPNPHLREYVERNGVNEREFLQLAMNRHLPLVSCFRVYLLATGQVVVGIPITKQATDFSNDVMKDLTSFIKTSRNLNRDLYQNTCRTQFMNNYHDTFSKQANFILEKLGNHSSVYNDPRKAMAANNLRDMLQEIYSLGLESQSNVNYQQSPSLSMQM